MEWEGKVVGGGDLDAQLKLRAQLMPEAERVRHALERAPGQLWFRNLHRFPVGCDRPAALVLGRWLERQGFGPISIAWEFRRHKTANFHCWVEVGGLIADVTGNQFNRKSMEQEQRGSVVVTGDRRWYLGFWGGDRLEVAAVLKRRPALRTPFNVLFARVVTLIETAR